MFIFDEKKKTLIKTILNIELLDYLLLVCQKPLLRFFVVFVTKESPLIKAWRRIEDKD